MKEQTMRVGIFGGSFDPVHYGHLILAELCCEAVNLDGVRLVPAAVPPHKQGQGRASGENRLAMLKLAIGGNPRPDRLGRRNPPGRHQLHRGHAASVERRNTATPTCFS